MYLILFVIALWVLNVMRGWNDKNLRRGFKFSLMVAFVILPVDVLLKMSHQGGYITLLFGLTLAMGVLNHYARWGHFRLRMAFKMLILGWLFAGFLAAYTLLHTIF